MRKMINEELLEKVTGGILAVPTVKDEPKIKKGEETGTVDPGSGSISGGTTAGW